MKLCVEKPAESQVTHKERSTVQTASYFCWIAGFKDSQFIACVWMRTMIKAELGDNEENMGSKKEGRKRK